MAYLKVNIIHDNSTSAGGGARCTDRQHDAQKNYVSMSPCLDGNEQHPLHRCTSGGGCRRVRMLMPPPRRQYHHRLDLMLTRDAVIRPWRRHLLMWLTPLTHHRRFASPTASFVIASHYQHRWLINHVVGHDLKEGVHLQRHMQ